MFKNLLKWKRKEEPCKHDWEPVYTPQGKYYRVCYMHSCAYYDDGESPYSLAHTASIIHSRVIPQYPQNKVCLKCGQCYNEVEQYKKAYEYYKKQEQLKTQKIKDRKELAKKLWKDKCLGKKNE